MDFFKKFLAIILNFESIFKFDTGADFKRLDIINESQLVIFLMNDVNFSLEITAHSNLNNLPKIKDIYITFLPGKEYTDVIKKSEELAVKGYNPVPHFPARSIKDRTMLRDFVNGVKNAGVNQVLIIGGDRDVLGEYHCSMQLIETGLFEDFIIGIAGHPEGSPNMSDEVIKTVMEQKAPFADYIVTQWALDSEKVKKFIQQAPLPVHVGVAGPATIKTLLQFASLVGVKYTYKFTKKNVSRVMDLLSVQTPDLMIEELRTMVDTFHIYAFGGIKNVNDWLTKKDYL